MVNRRILAVTVSAAGLTLGLAACSSGSSGTSASSSSAASAKPSSSSSSMASAMPSGSASTTAMNFGSGCASVPKSGAGSFSGMSTAPVATAASANPVLSTLVTAVKQAGLVDTLNSAKDITVFAPANSAFAKIPAATLKSVLANKAELTKILTYHVASGRYTPAMLATGKPIKTLEGGTVTPAGSGTSFTVNGAHVVCGNVQTANATVYIIDTVMMPKS
ncbi:MAG TPA: fasciclin domain-containing protein [Streptosporangiaceae bacterium]